MFGKKQETRQPSVQITDHPRFEDLPEEQQLPQPMEDKQIRQPETQEVTVGDVLDNHEERLNALEERITEIESTLFRLRSI